MDRAARRELDQINEKLNTPNLGVTGTVTVDLVDERGKITDRQEASNYVIQDMLDRWARWAQILPWTYGMSPGTVNVTSDFARDPRMGPSTFNDVLGCWDDASAEDPTDKYCFGEVVAWAHRWGQTTSPALRQGLVVPALCSLSEDELTWVWEWGTTTGNGTFQSVGWRRLQWGTPQTGDPQLTDLARYGRRMLPSPLFTSAGMTAGQTTLLAGFTLSVAAGYYDSGTGNLYTIGGLASAGRFVSVPMTFSDAGYTVGATVVESAHPIATHIGNGVAWTTYQTLGLVRMGASGDWISVGCAGSSTSRRCRIRRVTAAGSLTYTNTTSPAVESCYSDVTWDGTHLYAVRLTGTAQDIVQIDPATGNVNSALTLSGFPAYMQEYTSTLRGITGVEWDAVNGWLWVSTMDGRIFNINTSGVWQGVLMRNTAGHTSLITMSAPNAGDTSTYQNNLFRGPLDVDAQRMVGDQSVNTSQPFNQTMYDDSSPNAPAGNGVSGGVNMITMDGDVWMHTGGNGTAIGFYGYNCFTRGPNYASRSLLGAPVVKTSSDAMRISYTMEFT